jgi:hypothetical protein
MTIILPSYKGGSSGPTELGDEGKAVQALQEAQLPGDAVNYFYGNFLSSYWGDQPGTSGPVYFGALVCLFFYNWTVCRSQLAFELDNSGNDYWNSSGMGKQL